MIRFVRQVLASDTGTAWLRRREITEPAGIVTNAGVMELARLRKLEAVGPQIISACQTAFSARVKTRFTEEPET